MSILTNYFACLYCLCEPRCGKWQHMETPLHLAIKNGLTSIGLIEEIIKSGATLDAKDDEGKTPLMIAKEQSTPQGNEIADLLVKHGAHPFISQEETMAAEQQKRFNRSSCGTKSPDVSDSWPPSDNEDEVSRN